MENLSKTALICTLIVILHTSCSQSHLTEAIVDPGPGNDFPSSEHFSVTIDGIPSFAYQNFKRDTEEKYLARIAMDSVSWTSFVSEKPATVEVAFLGRDKIENVVVRPKSLGIESRIEGNTVRFEMPPGRKVTIEEEGNLKHVCFLFGHLEEPQPEGISSENIITFEAGVHRLDPDPLVLQSNQAVVLKPGAWIEGRIHGKDLENAQVVGRGTISASHVSRTGLQFGQGYEEKRRSRLLNLAGSDLRVQGPVIVDATYWSTHVEGTDPEKPNHISHTSVLGWYVNSDGFQNMTHTRASDLFTCVNDDSFILNNIGDCVVERSVVWGQLAGAPLRLGWNGTIDLQPIVYRDIDILHFDGRAGVISLKHGGPSHVKDITIEDIRIEEPTQRLIELEIKKHLWSPKNTGFGHVSNITLRNITADHPFINDISSHIHGANADHLIKDVILENIRIGGKQIEDFVDIPLELNEFTENIVIR